MAATIALEEHNFRLELKHRLDQIEKAFASNCLSDVLPMISNCSIFMRDIPFPSFIIEVLFRLAKLFKGDYTKMEQHLNTIRLRIITTLRESRECLTNIPYSTDSIVMEIMKVSHSNDYKARALTLLVLGFLAPIIFENKKVHHLLIESLDSSEKSELISAIFNSAEISKYSRSFTSIVVDKLNDLINLHQNDCSISLHLLNALNCLESPTTENKTTIKKTEQNVNANSQKHSELFMRYIISGNCSEIEAKGLVASIISTESNFQNIILNSRILRAICDKYPRFLQAVNVWSSQLLTTSKVPINEAPITLFDLIFYTHLDGSSPSATDQNFSSDFVNNLMKLNPNYWTIYKIARAALRNGLWKSTALPLLQEIHKKCDSNETNSWIEALIYIAQSQPQKFSVAELNNAENNLRDAALLLKTLKSLNHARDHHFDFSFRYVECLTSTINAIKRTLVTLNVKTFPSSVFQDSGPIPDAYVLNTISSLRSVSVEFSKSTDRWKQLYSRSFDSGYQTLTQIDLMMRLNELIIALLRTLFDANETLNFKPIIAGNFNSTNRKICGLINRVSQMIAASLNNLNHEGSYCFYERIKLFKHALSQLIFFPFDLPQYFFTKKWITKIRLNLQPQPSDADGILRVSSAELVPIAVEGIIETNNPNGISTVCVVLTKNNNPLNEERKIVGLENERYFKAQFVLKVNKTIKVQISLSFTDQTNKKIWYDESNQTVFIVITPTDV